MKKQKYLFRRKNRIKKPLLLFSISLMTAAVIFFFCQRFVFAATCNWQSTGSSSWNTIGNWSCGHVPTSADDVYFTNSYPADVSLDADVNVQSINIGSSYPGNFNQNNHQITVGSGGFSLSMGNFVGSSAPMTVNGNMTISGGTFTQPTLPFDTTSGLTAYWNMDEASGTTTVADSSGNGITATSSSSTNVTTGKIGNARSFDGTQYVYASDNVGLGSSNMTVAAWVYPTAFVDQAPIYNRRTSGNVGGVTMQLNGTGGSVSCFFYISGAWRNATTSQTLIQNRWNHVSCTYDGSTIKPYINGILDSNTTSYIGAINNPTSPSVEIGRNISNTSDTYKWKGNIDEVKIYNRALDNNSIAVLAQSAISLSVSGNYSQTEGGFTGSPNNMDINGSFSLSGGSFIAPSGSLNNAGSFTVISPGTFTHNNGTLTLDGTIGGGSLTFDASGVIFNLVTINRTVNGCCGLSLTVASGTTLPLGNSPTITLNNLWGNYNFVNNGTLTVGTGTLTSAIKDTFTNNGTINLSSATAWVMNGGTFVSNTNFNVGNLTSWTGTGSLTNSASQTITATGLTTFSIADITNSGTINASNAGLTAISTGSITNNGTINTPNVGTFTISGTLTNNSGATFNMTSSPTFNVGGGFVVNSSSTFPTANVTLNLNGNVGAGNLSIDASGITFNTPVVFNRTVNGCCSLTLTVASGTTLPLGNSPTITLNNLWGNYNFVNNGTLTVGTGTLTSAIKDTFTNNGTINLSSATAWIMNASTFTNNSGASVSANSSLNFTVSGNTSVNSASTFPTTLASLTISGSSGTQTYDNPKTTTYAAFVKNAASTVSFSQGFTTGDFTISSGTISNPASSLPITITGNFSQSGGTLGGANLPLNFSGSGTQTLSQTSGTFSSPFTINKSGGSLSLSTAFSPTSTCTITAGTFDINGKIFTCGSTFFVNNSGTLKLVGSESPTTPTLDTGSTVEYKGNGDSLSNTYIIKNWSYQNLIINTTDSSDIISNSLTYPANSLAAYWKLDEPQVATTVTDSSPNNLGGAIVGTTAVSGKINNARNFAGAANSVIKVNNNPAIQFTTNIAACAWVNPTTINTTKSIFSKMYNNSYSQYGFGLINNRLVFYYHTSDGGAYHQYETTNPSFVNGNWYHVCMSFNYGNGSSMNMYVNSVLQTGSWTSGNGNSIPSTCTNQLWLGTQESGNYPNYFYGNIDELFLYSRTLTQSDVNLLFSLQLPVTSLSVSNNLTISSGTFVSPATLTIGGNFTNNGTFTHNNGTVVFNDASKASTISGSGSPAVTFYNLTSTTPGKTLNFTNGETFRINGLFTLTGTSSNKINLSSTTPSQWLVDHQGTEAVTNAIITNSGCAAGTTEISLDTTNTNGGNDGACWAFVPPNSPRLKGGARLKGGVRLK